MNENHQLLGEALLSPKNHFDIGESKRSQYLSEDEGVSEDRKAFLDTAIENHLGAEAAKDILGAINTFAEAGSPDFNGVMFHKLEELATFHHGVGSFKKVAFAYPCILIRFV